VEDSRTEGTVMTEPPTTEKLLAFDEYEECEAECCPICGSFSPSHIQEDDDGPCGEPPPLWTYFR
jgi:hypothetical protein